MKSLYTGGLLLVAGIMASLACADARVEFRDCPKCDKRFRIDLAAGKAYVNISRLEGASREAVAARAARLLDAAKIPEASDPKIRPLMGWSSWNTFGIDISETIILETARAMATNGLKDAGYTYVNIDDGFFAGHGPDGVLRFHPQRFPNGMKPVVDGIHALGLKAGIYSDAGADTCGSIWGGSSTGEKDVAGIGAGLYGHDAADCKLHFNDLGFDFIKVDYCGGGKLKLDERKRYTEIAEAIKATGRTDVRFNICRWAFPGTWAADIAESWRTTRDIRANWKTVKELIAENLYLSAYAKPGHYNDMDMLEVGQHAGRMKTAFGKHGDTGLTPDEEVTHFGIWCMLSSPLLIGCDVRTIPESTKALITNPYLLAVNQNDLGCQAYVAQRSGDACILVKDADVRFGKARYVALYNASDKEHTFTVKAAALDLGGRIDAFDLVEMADIGRFTDEVCVTVAPHATKFFRFDAEKRLPRTVYEAETAYLSDYQELTAAEKALTPFPARLKDASGEIIVRNLGTRESNDLLWKEVEIGASGTYDITIAYSSPDKRAFALSVDGLTPVPVEAPATGAAIGTATIRRHFANGVHSVRLSSTGGAMPDIDCMTLAAVPVPAMLTPWGEKVTSDNCLREYPRPQMERAGWVCLNGDWDYAITSITNTTGRPTAWDGKIRVPFALEAPLSGCGGRLLRPDEYLWYSREVTLDPKPGEKILLHFGAVDFRAIVYLGHDEVACTPHDGGQLPFTVDLTPFARKGTNTLTVLVWDPTEDFINSRGKQAFRTHSCFYTRMSGIWQTVWLETVPERHIADYNVSADIDKGEVTLTVDVAGVAYADAGFFGPEKGQIEIFDGGESIASARFLPGRPCTIPMPENFGLWSPESPKLYNFTARFGSDEVKGYFAMRKFEKRKDAKGIWRFFLNNKPYYVLGTLDQGWWPDGLLTPPSEEAMAFDIQTLKDCGFNTMRKHIKVEPLRYYALCDRMGLLVLQDMPCSSVDRYDPLKWETTKGYGLFRKELKDMIDLLRKIPSIVMWVPYNEGWGQHDRHLTHTTLDFVRRYDTSRLVDGPSGWQDFEGGEVIPLDRRRWRRIATPHMPEGVCEAGDIVDYHYYRGPAMPPVNPRRISFLGEFGGLGHPVDGHLWRAFAQASSLGGSESGDWGYGGIDDTKTRAGLEKAYLDLMDRLAALAEQGLAGSIYTQTTDVEIEINGLLTYDRKVLKFNPETLKNAHAEVCRRAEAAAK